MFYVIRVLLVKVMARPEEHDINKAESLGMGGIKTPKSYKQYPDYQKITNNTRLRIKVVCSIIYWIGQDWLDLFARKSVSSYKDVTNKSVRIYEKKQLMCLERRRVL